MGRNSLIFIAIVIVGVALVFAGLAVGTIAISIEEVLESILHYNPNNDFHYIIMNLRLPRIVLAMLTGASLGLAGYLMQAMVNNPLADPFILGTASGASLGVNVASLFVFPVFMTSLIPVSLFAFAGAILVTILAVVVAYDNGRIIPSRLLLAGIALSSFMVALTTLLIYSSASETKLKKVVFWTMGSFEQASWLHLPFISIGLIISILVFTVFTKHLNILLLGEERAENLGVNVVRLRWIVLCGASFLTAMAVALSGPVGFVGLMVPHFVRGLFGVHGKLNVLFTSLIGGIFLIACDLLARLIFQDAALPIGIITSFLGIPFFVYLLTKKNYRFS